MEAYHTSLHWLTPAIVSNVPLYWYSLMLLFDFFLYYGCALILALNQFQTKEKIFIQRFRSSQSTFSGLPERTPKPKSWINLAKLGIPMLFRESSLHYIPIPSEEDVSPEKSYSTTLSGNNAAIVISSLSKSYETIEGYPIEVLKNLNGELKSGSITTLLGR
jgi:hypothetical protein